MAKIDRFRWTDEEKRDILKQLMGDPALGADLEQDKRAELVSIADYIEPARERIKDWGKIQGVKSGYHSLDAMTKGFVPGELIIVSGQTSHGKTMLASNIAHKVINQGKVVLFVTLEMTKEELTARFIKLGEPHEVGHLPLLFQSSPDLSHKDISNIMRRAKLYDADLVIFDHLHYFVRSVEFASSEIGRIVKQFKTAAIQHDVPVMLLCHVRKTNTTREIPKLDDLRDSSFIAQDADIVLMVWRNIDPENNDRRTDELDIAILKNRNRGLFRDAMTTTLYADGVSLKESRL